MLAIPGRNIICIPYTGGLLAKQALMHENNDLQLVIVCDGVHCKSRDLNCSKGNVLT